MFSLFSRKKSQFEVPDWAGYFDGNQYEKFMALVDAYFQARNIQYTVGGGEIHVGDTTFGFDRLGLVNLAQMCNNAAEPKWKKMISDHFDGLASNALFEKEFESKIHDFDSTKGFLGVRLYHNDYVAAIDKSSMIGWQVTDDIFAMLVFDFPQSIANVKPDQTVQWNKTYEELFVVGIANIKGKYETELVSYRIDEYDIWIAQGQHFFVPNIIFDIKNNQTLVGTRGALVAIPHRSCALFYPIENLQVVKCINQLIPIVYRMEQEGPGSISSNLYWYDGCRFVTLPCNINNEKLQFYPPEDFVEMLNSLQAG